MDLSALLQRCCAGDELAWEALVRQFQGRIYAAAYYIVGNPEDARDLAQETFIRVYQNLGICPGAQRFVPWIMRIARNLCIDHLRRKKARPQTRDVEAEVISALPGSGKNPEEQYAADSRERMVYRALQDLTVLNREMIVLKEIQGLPLEEIASLLEIPLGTVKSRCNRARLELAQKLLAFKFEFADVSAT